MDPVSEKQSDKNQLLQQQTQQRQLQHQQQQQLLKQQLQQQFNRQQFQQQQSQQLQSQTEQQQQRLLQIQSQSQQQQNLSQIAPQFQQQQQQNQPVQLSTKQQQSLRSNQGILQQQILQQEHLKQQKLLLDNQKKQEQALLDILQMNDTNGDENGAQEQRLIAQQQRPQLIQEQQQLHLKQQKRQQQDYQQELHLLQQKQLQQPQHLLQQSSQLIEQSQLAQQTQQQQSQEIQPQFVQHPHLVKQSQVVHKPQLVQQSQIVHQTQIMQHSQILNQSQVTQQPQLIQQPQLVQQPKIIQSQQLVTMSTPQQTKKQPSHSQQVLQQQIHQLLSKNKNFSQRYVVLGSQPQQQQLVAQQSPRVLTANTPVQQQLLPQQMQCVVVTGAGQPQSQQMQRVVVAATGQQKQQPQQMQRVVVTSTSGQKQQQLTQQQLQQIQHVVIPGANQQQSLQIQNVINSCSVQQQPQQMQRVVVAATGQTQSQLQQTQRVIVTSTSGQQQQQLVQSLQPVPQRIVIGQLKTCNQTQQIQSPSQRSVVLGHVQQQLIQRPSPAKQQQQRVVIAGQQQLLKLPSQQQSVQQLLKLPQSQQTSQQLLKLPQEMLLQQQQLSQQLSQPKPQQNDIQQQNKQVTQQQANLKSSDQSLVQQLHVKQSHQQLQQLHIQPSQKQLQQQQKPLKQNQPEQQIDLQHRSGSVIIGQRQQTTRPESDDLQQKQLQQLQRKNLQERIVLQQQDKQQKHLQEQLQQKQQLREQILLQQHLKQQHQLLLKQQAFSDNRVSFMTGINQEQKQQDKETNHHQQGLRVQKRFIAKTADAGQFLLGELVSLSSSSDEDDDDDMLREQRNLFHNAKCLVYEHFNAIAMVLEPRYQVCYVDLLKKWINGQLSRDEFNLKFHKMICESTTSIESGDCILNDATVMPTNSSQSSTINAKNDEIIVPTLNTVTGKSMLKSEEETVSLSPSINNSMAQITSTLKKVEEKHREIGMDVAITKRVQLHNALVASLTAYMPFQILQQKRRQARARGFTETGFPLRLFTYMDVPQVRESITHWYPHAAGSLAHWCWPAKTPCMTSLLENNIEKQSLKSFRKSQQKEIEEAVATAILFRPPSYESLPSLLEVTKNTEIAQTTQLHNFQNKKLIKLEMNAIKRSRRKQLEQMAQKIRLRDWLTNWLRQLKIQGQELEHRERLMTENLRQQQTQILNRRRTILTNFKTRQLVLEAKVQIFFEESVQELAKYQGLEFDADSEDNRQNDRSHFLIKIKEEIEILDKILKESLQSQQMYIANSLPSKIIRNPRRNSMISMITLVQDRITFQSNRQMLQEIRQECLQIRKVYDHVREIRKKYCPCCECNIRPCQYRKLMRKLRQMLRVHESNVIEDEIESNLENEVAVKEKMEIIEIKKPETLSVDKDKANDEKKKISITKVTEPLNKRSEDIQQKVINTSIDTVNVSSKSENAIIDTPNSMTITDTMSYKTTDNITENETDSSMITSKSTVVTSISQTSDIVNPVVEVDKHDVGVTCELVRSETQQTRVEVLGGPSIQQRPSSLQDQCSIVNVADYAARAAEAALAASRRSDRRSGKSMPIVAINEPKESVESDDDDDNDDNNCNRQASKLMPPPPPLPPTLPSQPKVATTSRKPTMGARYLQQQQLLLDRHKQLERMRREEEEKQQKARFQHQRQQREYKGKEKEKSNMMMEIDEFSTGPMQLTGSGGSKKLPTVLSQNMYPGSNDEDHEAMSCPSHSKDKNAERSQQNNYYFYCGDYYSSDDETSGSSSIEPPFPPLLHDLRIDQLPRPSSRVPAAAVLPPGVRKRQLQIPQSVLKYDSQQVECQQTQSVLQPRMHRESKKRRNANEPVQKELFEHGELPKKPLRSSPLHSRSPPLGRENTELGTYSCKKLPNKMQSNLRKRLQFELLEKPGQRQQYQQYQNDDEPMVDGNSQNETAELHQQQIISPEKPTNSKMAKSNSRYKVFEKCSAGVEEKTYQEHVVDVKHELVVQQKNNEKQLAVPLVSKKKTKRQSKRIGSRRKMRKRKDKTSVLKDEDSSSLEEENDFEGTLDIEELRMVQWKAPLTQWNKRPISYGDNINQERAIEENVNVIEQQTEREMEGDVDFEEDTKRSNCNQSQKNKMSNYLWQQVSEIRLQDSEFNEMKRLDLEYRELIRALLSNNRIKNIIDVQQFICENTNANSSSDNPELPSLFSLSSHGDVKKQLDIHQIHYWMSQIQLKREEIFHFMKRVQENLKHDTAAPEVHNNKIVIIKRKETIAEVDILREWHDLFLSKYDSIPNDNVDYLMYNDKRLFIIQDLIDQYYPITDNNTFNNKWLRVAKISLHNSEFNEMKRLIFDYRKLMNILMSNQQIKELVQIQQQIFNYAESSDDEGGPTHLIRTSPGFEKNIEHIRDLMLKIQQKWEEMNQLLEKIKNDSRADIATDKQLVLTQRVEPTKEIDKLRFWHDFIVSTYKGNDKPNDDSEIIDHFLIQELVDRYYPRDSNYDTHEFKMLVNPKKQNQIKDGVVIVLGESDNSNDDDDEGNEEMDESKQLELEKRILRFKEIQQLDQKRAFWEHFKEQSRGKLKNKKGELKQLSKLRQDQYRRHGLSGTLNKKKGFNDILILKSAYVNPTLRRINDGYPMRHKLFYKIIQKKLNLIECSENQQQTNSKTCTTKFDVSPSSYYIKESIFNLMTDSDKLKGSGHWWARFGFERRISPLIMKTSTVKIQTRPMVTVPFINQLQLTKPQTRTREAQVVVNEQPPITPIMPTNDQKKILWKYIDRIILGLMTDSELKWLNEIQLNYTLIGAEWENLWQVILNIKQKQVGILYKIPHDYQEQHPEKVIQEQILMQNMQSKEPSTSTFVFCLELGTDAIEQWNLLEAERKSYEKKWKSKLSLYYELIVKNRLYFREMFKRLKDHLALDNDQGRISVMKKMAYDHFSRNFLPLNEAEREKLSQVMLKPNPIVRGFYHEYSQKVLNILKESESKTQDLQSQLIVNQEIKTFKLEQLLNLIITDKVSNLQKLYNMPSGEIKQLLQEQSDQLYREEQNKILLKNPIYKYKQTKSEQERIKFVQKVLRDFILLHNYQRLQVLEQLDRVNELLKTNDQDQGQRSQAFTSSTQQMSKTSVILIPQPTVSKQKSSKSTVILTPHKPSTFNHHSSASLIPHNLSTSLQSSIISVRPQPRPSSSEIQPDKSLSTLPTLEMIEETQKILEHRLSQVNIKLIPLMKLWKFFLYFPETYLYQEIDDIVESRFVDLGVDIREELQSIMQELEELSDYDCPIGLVDMREITMQRFKRLNEISDYIKFQRNRMNQLVNELAILMYHDRPVVSTYQSSWGKQEPKYSMLINLERGLMKNDSNYSMSLTFQRPLSCLQRCALPLLQLPNELPTFKQENTTHSLLLKLRRPSKAIQESNTYSATIILLDPFMSNQIAPIDSKLLKTQPMLMSKQQSPSSSVICTPQQPSTSKHNLSPSQTFQQEQLSISSVSTTRISQSIVGNSKIINNHLNKNREKRRLSSGDENENCGKRLKSTFKKKHSSSSLAINRKRQRQISIPHQTKKPTLSVHDDKDTDTVIISDSDVDYETSDTGSESSPIFASIQNPTTSMTVQRSDKSPLTIKLVRVKPSPLVVVTSAEDFEKKSMKDDSEISIINPNDNQNYIDKEKKKVESKKNVDKKNKKMKQKVSDKEELKETNRCIDNEDDKMEMTKEKENLNKIIPVFDNRVPTSTKFTALINQPSQVSIIVNKPIEVGAVVSEKPTKEIIGKKKPIKVALVESGPLMTSAVDGKKIRVISKSIKPVNVKCAFNEVQRRACVDHTMSVIKGIVNAAEKTIKKIPTAFTQTPIKLSMEQCKTNQFIDKCQINTDTINTNNNHSLAIPIRKNTIEKFRHSVRTVTMDFEKPAVPVFYDHGFAEGSPERVVHNRFVSTIMSMMAAHSIALRPQLKQPQRLQLLMECATKKLYSKEPLTIGGVNINEYSTLSSLLDKVISQDSTVETSSIDDVLFHNSCETSNLMFDHEQIKKQVNISRFKKHTASISSLTTRPSRLTTIKTTSIVEKPATTKIKQPVCFTSTLASISDVDKEDQITAKSSASIEFMSTPSLTMTTTSFSSLPPVGLEISNSYTTTTSNFNSSMALTKTPSGSNTIKQSALAVSLVSSSATSNTTTTSPSLLVNLPKRSKSAVMTTIPATIIDTTESITEAASAPSNNLKRSRPVKRSTSVTTVSSPSAVGPPKRSKSAVAMTVSPCSEKTVTIQTTPIMTPTKTTVDISHKSHETSTVPTTDTFSGISKNTLPFDETSYNSNTSEMEETIITKEEMRTVTVKRNLCTSIPAYMDVSNDACALVVSACEQYIRNMVKERLSKGGRGAGTLELRRRDAFIAAMVVDDDIRPVPEYSRTIDLGKPEIDPVTTDPRTNDNSRLVLEQQRFQNYIPDKPKQLDILTFETVVETQTTTTTTTSISSNKNKQFPTVTSSTTKTISSPLVTVINTSARTRGGVVPKKKTTPSPPVTVAKSTITVDKLPIVDNPQLENGTILSPNKQPASVPLTRKRPLTVPSAGKEYIAGPSTIKPPNRKSLNNGQSTEIPSTSKLPTAVSTSTTVKQFPSKQSLSTVTDAMEKPQTTTSVVVKKTPPISTLKKEANLMVRKSSSAFSVQNGRLIVPPTFHRRRPFGPLETTCRLAAAEATEINKNTHIYSRNFNDVSDDEDEDGEEWSCYWNDRTTLPPLSRLVNLPLFGHTTKVPPVVTLEKNDTSRDGARDKIQCIPKKTSKIVEHVLEQGQRPSVSSQDNEEEKKVPQQLVKLNSEQDDQSKRLENSMQDLYEHKSNTPESLKVYHKKFLELQYGLTENPLMDQQEMRHHKGLVSWY